MCIDDSIHLGTDSSKRCDSHWMLLNKRYLYGSVLQSVSLVRRVCEAENGTPSLHMCNVV